MKMVELIAGLISVLHLLYMCILSKQTQVFTHAKGSRGSRVSLSFVGFSARHLKNSRITKLYVEMFHHESWEPVYFGLKGQGDETQVCRCSDGLQHCRWPCM